LARAVSDCRSDGILVSSNFRIASEVKYLRWVWGVVSIVLLDLAIFEEA
jgi:hypothetical protein